MKVHVTKAAGDVDIWHDVSQPGTDDGQLTIRRDKQYAYKVAAGYWGRKTETMSCPHDKEGALK